MLRGAPKSTQMMAEHSETFIERTRSAERQLPRYVERELRAYRECGILARGFLPRRRGPMGPRTSCTGTDREARRSSSSTSGTISNQQNGFGALAFTPSSFI